MRHARRVGDYRQHGLESAAVPEEPQVSGDGRRAPPDSASEEFQRNVLGIVGHDLRNPLSALVTSAQLLVRSERLPPELTRLAVRMLANAARMDRIISVLLDYARVRGGQPIPLRARRTYLLGLVESAAEECEASRPGREVRRAGPTDVAGEWDPDRIAQVLVNLLGNALDYSPAESVVELGWRVEGPHVAIEISNEGRPIPSDVIPQLFEPFRRAERERSGGRDGLGLGLFIARAIVEAHGGAVEVRSTGAGRTSFVVRLPCGPADAPDRD